MPDDLEVEFLTDAEGAALFKMGSTRFAELQREADFPNPLWLGPRGKRHLRSELLAYALKKRTRAPDSTSQSKPAPSVTATSAEVLPTKRPRGRPRKVMVAGPAAEATT